MREKTLSVIIVAYNAEQTIKRCISSIFDGVDDSYLKRTEVIVTDDASADATAKIAERFGDRIRLVKIRKNGGCVAKTRNVGLAAAEGEYITFLDADDWYESGAVQKIIDYIDEFKPDIIRYGYTLVFSDNTRKTPKHNPKEFRFIAKSEFKDEVYPKFINGISLNSVCLAVFRRNIAQGVKFPVNFCTAEDAAFAMDIYTNAETVLFAPDRLYCYYRGGGGLTGSGLGIRQKFKYNFMLVPIMSKHLSEWKMNTLLWRIKTVVRPFSVAIDKLKRLK